MLSVSASKCAGIVGCSCYIFQPSRNINSKMGNLWILPALQSASDMFVSCTGLYERASRAPLFANCAVTLPGPSALHIVHLK